MEGNWFLTGDAVAGADVGLLPISHARWEVVVAAMMVVLVMTDING